MIRLNVFIKTSVENREKVLEITKKLVEGSVRDAGCIAYDVFASGTNPESLFICETWENEESLAAHGKAASLCGVSSCIERISRTESGAI